jgi:hypothetical protein
MSLRPKVKEKRKIKALKSQNVTIKEESLAALKIFGIIPRRVVWLKEQDGVRIFLHDGDHNAAKQALKTFDSKYYSVRNGRFSPHIEVYGV